MPVRFSTLIRSCAAVVAIAAPLWIGGGATGQAQAQPAGTTAEPAKPLTQATSLLSLEGGARLMQEAQAAVSAQNYDLAEKKLQEARQLFNQVSNFYQDLAKAFLGIDNRVSGRQREMAVKTAEMRDQATYQLALVHRAKNQMELSVPLLIQIINSQGPTRELGKQAYQQLFEIGFVDTAYPRVTDGAKP